MDEKQLKAAIRTVLLELMEEKRSFWVPPEQHFLDHDMLGRCREQQAQWRKNHEFVAAVREGAGTVRKVAIGTCVSSLVAFFLAAVWLLFKTNVRQ